MIRSEFEAIGRFVIDNKDFSIDEARGGAARGYDCCAVGNRRVRPLAFYGSVTQILYQDAIAAIRTFNE